MKKLLMVLASCGCLAASAGTTYTLTVESGEQKTLDVAMTAAYPGATLAAGDTIVKMGAGVLKDASAALALDQKLVFDVQEGVFVENVARKGSTYRVADGAAVEVSVDLYKIGTSSAVAHFELNGSGTADRPGALYLSTSSQSSDQFIEVTLKGDAVIYCNGKTVNFSSWSDTSASYNVFNLNGHSLRFKQPSATNYFRFRHAVTFNKPGEIIFDSCGVTRYSGGEVYIDEATATIPCVKLVNGAKFNCVNNKFASKIRVLDCEAGTTIGKVNDAPSDYTLSCLKGCPTITAEQKVTVKSYVARANDLLNEKKLTSAGSFGFENGGDIWVDGCADLAVGTDYQLIETTTALTGEAPTRGLKDIATVRQEEKEVWFKPTANLADYFTVFVPDGDRKEYWEVVKGVPNETLQGKTLMKLGGGGMTYSSTITNGQGQTILKGTVVKNGTVGVTMSWGVPISEDGKKRFTVEDGSTLQIAVQLINFATSAAPLESTFCGGGYSGLGAIRFETDGGSNGQNVTYTLTGDSTIVSVGNCTLSSGFNTQQDVNRFNMNGHDLTFRSGKSSNYFRFRYGVTFCNPGTITFLNTGVTHLPGASVFVYDADGKACQLPLVRLIANASANFADSKFADAVGVVECESGTKLCGIKTDTDKPKDITLACVKGCPEISNERTVTIGKYIARAADVSAGKKMVAKGTLTFASGATVGVDTLEGLTIPDAGSVLAQGEQGVAGSPKKEVSIGRNRVRVATVDGVDSLLLLPGQGLLLFVR